ncbi:HDOD domain-containing protein [Neptuniibacter caesariensis]|uniref:Predicted signal transduction protein n=1 Tax=Neptuniibacter caesariensis TaxID=207954 RepID=A0A7U8C6P5_NEPCE|nr:HDOD domain-containing protein [Neptuniibacter caesariensis]EAR61085.1 Predicted signal transduction protein [Neptuniibacter caesariensis]
MKYTETLKNIHRSLDRLGDLPVFSATVNRIQQISASEESDAMALAMAIMKDTGLTARLLKLANSPVYKRGQGNINVVSRAVVLLGFNQIKNICLTLKLIESFHDEHPDLDVPGLMMRQFLSANIAKELAIRADKAADPEEAYIGALLFGLGEVMVACTMPDQYRKLLRLKSTSDKKWPTLQAEVLGISFSELGREMAAGWGYPKQVTNSMSQVQLQQLDEKSDLLNSLPSLANGLVQQVYGQDHADEQPYDQLVDAVSLVGGIPFDDVGEVTLQCFRQVAKVSRVYGLKTSSLIPEFTETGNIAKDDMVRQLSFLAHSEAENIAAEEAIETVQRAEQEELKRSEEQLDYLNRLTELIASEGKIHEVFKLVIEAIRKCSNFDRSMLCLLGKKNTHLSVKMIEGDQIEPLQAYFERSKNGKADDLFFKVLSKQVTLLVNDLDEEGWRKRLPPDFVGKVDCHGFVLIPLTMGNRVIGMLYADKLNESGAVSEDDFNAFNHFATQTRLALMYADSKR